MLVVKSQNGKTDVGISGDVVELLSDLSASIRTIYNSLKENCNNEEIADFFKYACVNHLMDITFDDKYLNEEVKESGIDDLYEELKEKRKKNKGEKEKQIEKLNMLFESMMKDLLDD